MVAGVTPCFFRSFRISLSAASPTASSRCAKAAEGQPSFEVEDDFLAFIWRQAIRSIWCTALFMWLHRMKTGCSRASKVTLKLTREPKSIGV